MNEKDLDRLLAEARANPPAPSPDFMARILGDALAEQPRSAPAAAAPALAPAVAPERRPRRRAGLWARLAAGLGGSGVLAGLGVVALTGLWLGYADPAGLTDSYLTYADAAGLELVPAAELFLNEG